MRGRHGGEGVMEEGDIGHHCLLIWFFDTYVCNVGRSGDIRAEIKDSGIEIKGERGKGHIEKFGQLERVVERGRRGRGKKKGRSKKGEGRRKGEKEGKGKKEGGSGEGEKRKREKEGKE